MIQDTHYGVPKDVNCKHSGHQIELGVLNGGTETERYQNRNVFVQSENGSMINWRAVRPSLNAIRISIFQLLSRQRCGANQKGKCARYDCYVDMYRNTCLAISLLR